MLSRLASLFRSFAGDRVGNVAVITAFAALPLVGITGLAIDYSTEVTVKTKLDHAADAAALAGITTAQTYLASYAGSGDVTAAALAAGQTQGLAQFKSNTGTIPSGTLQNPTVTVTSSGQTLTGTATYSFTMPTVFMRALGISTMSFSGSATSSLTVTGYNNIYVVIDTSSSMGIGATLADQQIVYKVTGGCAVACHYSGTTTTARSAGATLRIDVAKSAVKTAIDQLIQIQNTQAYAAGKYKIAIYTMSNSLTNVFPLSSNLASAKTAVDSIDISNANRDGGTDTTDTLTQLQNLAAPGNGLTSTAPLGTIMLITDGVQDSDMKVASGGNFVDSSDPNFTVFSPCVKATCQAFPSFGIVVEAFDPTKCTPLKNKGFKIMTLNVQYLVPPSNLQSSTSALNEVFTYIQNYLISSIPTNMAACATSTSNAYVANTPSEIQSAVSTMFASVASVARLTQ